MEAMLQTWKPICGDFLLPEKQFRINIDHNSIGNNRKPLRQAPTVSGYALVARIHDQQT